jgi:hypothetical protein
MGFGELTARLREELSFGICVAFIYGGVDYGLPSTIDEFGRDEH